MGSKENNYIERYWRDATPKDAIREPPMVARFKTDDPGPVRYIIDKLVGVVRTNAWMWRTATGGYLHCQVYDAPDPGEGWRLIDVDKETPKVGDGIYYPAEDRWLNRQHDKPYDKELIYRRRIEQPKTEPKYVPFTWEDREQLRGRWIYQVGDENAEQIIIKMDFTYNEFYANNKSARQLLNGWLFLDTGEPVGKRVQ